MVAIAAKLSVSFRCLALLPVATESVMVRITGEECMSLMPAKDAGIRPVAFLKLSSNMSVNVITHLFSPPFLFLFDNDISLSMCINNTIYRYYSHISGESFGAREIWPAGVDGKRDGAQCGIAACVLIVRTNSCIAWVRGFLNAQPVSFLDAIVSHNDAARTRKLDRPREVLRVGIFIGIDKNQVEWSLCRKEWQRLRGGTDADFGAVIHLGLAERLTHHVGMGSIDFQGNQPSVRRQGSRQPDAAIASQSADLEDLAGLAGGG